MIKQTAQLIFKALVIGILLNVGLGQVPTTAQTLNSQEIQPSLYQAPLNSAGDIVANTAQ
ncbi:hypothetical protein QUF64_01315 [Anaerolineales bacterium HSG6]|nr:hypothetical protein [Anaerolineales bacterium HSG6]MDM8530265.1 hypothetical protein [Anaerolineales bacterium HSG25]